MAFFENGDSKIFYEVEGEGTPVLLLAPGGMRSANTLWENMPWNPRKSLIKKFKFIVLRPVFIDTIVSSTTFALLSKSSIVVVKLV